MSEQAGRAFGRYLEELRGRAGLSIGQVSRLAANSPQTIDKSSLWRFEKGKQRPSVAALLPLSRIYDASANVLLERLELDMELERAGAPETEGRTDAELQRLGHDAMKGSRRWEAYGYFRDAVACVERGNGARSSRDADRRHDLNRMYLASVGRAIGKNHFALHEFGDLLAHGDVGPARTPILIERMAHCYRCTGRANAAEQQAGLALAEARSVGQQRIMAFAHSAQASLAIDQGSYRLALEKLRLAYQTYRGADGDGEVIDAGAAFEVALLLNFAEVYQALGQFGRSKRAAMAARRIGRAEEVPLGVAYGSLLLGMLLEREGRGELALRCWAEATECAAGIHHTKVAFAAELYTFRHATANGLPGLAGAAAQRLSRLAPWVPEHTPAYLEWKQLRETAMAEEKK